MSKNFELLQQAEGNLRRTDSRERILGIRNDSRPVRESPGQPAYPNDDLAWTRALPTLKKHYALATGFALCVFGVVAVVTLLMKPVYEPSTSIEIDPPGTQTLSLDARGESSNSVEYLETQAKILQSDQLALDVIRKLRLDQHPDFADASSIKQTISVPPQADDPVLQLTPRENAALKTFRAHLNVQRDSASRLATVSFASHDPRIAAQVGNTLVSEFIEKTHEAEHEAIMQSSAWLSRQLDDIRAKMEQSNQALAQFQKATGIADLDANRNTFAEQMSELDRQFASAQGDRIQFEAVLQRVHNGSPEALPQVGENPVVQHLSQKLAEARVELSQAQALYGRNHPNVRKLQNEVNELQTQLDLRKRDILAELEMRYAASKSRERLLEGERKSTAKDLNQLAQYNTLRKQAQADADLYNSLYARVKEAGIAAGSNSNNIRVIDRARILDAPSRPRIPLNLTFGLLAGVFGGVVIAFLREALDNKIHTVEDIRGATGISTVSVLPVIDAGDCARAALGAIDVSHVEKKHGHFSSKFLLERPNSAEAEALRGLHTSVMLSRWGAPPQVLLVMSAFPEEGKTTVASNLAIALAQHGSTCIVDTDLRRSSIAKIFGVDSKYGLVDVLAGSASLDQAITASHEVRNLSVLTAGAAVENPGELMVEHAISGVVAGLRQRFQFVVFDSPPILLYTDGRVLSTLSDGLIFVGRYGVTTGDAISRSMELLSEIHAAPILGVVLNAANSSVPDYQYFRKYANKVKPSSAGSNRP
jgi:polysaccharide biosynthesis transport protein